MQCVFDEIRKPSKIHTDTGWDTSTDNKIYGHVSIDALMATGLWSAKDAYLSSFL